MSTASSEPPKGWVLVVDDDPEMLRLVAMKLERAGYKVTTASDAWQSVIQSQGLRPILVVSDIQMPGAGTGVDALRKLRTMAVGAQLPVIFMTGMELEKARQSIPPDPKVRLLAKPVDFALMRQAIKELIGVDREL